MKRTKEKGITLIALIVTVIILLMLTGISISMVNGDGLFSKSKTSVTKYTSKQLEENMEIKKSEYLIDSLGNMTLSGYVEYIQNNDIGDDIVDVQQESETETTITTKSGYQYSIKSKGGDIVIDYKGHLENGKMDGQVELSEYSGAFDLYEEKTINIITNLSDGELSAESSDPTVASVVLTKDGSLGSIKVKALKENAIATITVTSAAKGNYLEASAEYSVGVLNVIKLTATPYSGTYDGNAHGITVESTTPGVTITYSTDGVAYTSVNPTFTDSTTEQTIYYKAEKAGYTTVTGSVTVTIGKANGGLTLSETSGTITYPTAKEITVSNNTGVITAESSNTSVATVSVNGNTITITPQILSTTGQTATITVKSTDPNGNYTEASATYATTVNMGTISVTSESGYSGTYTGAARSIEVSYTPSDATITYSTDGTNYSSTKPTYTDASASARTIYYRIAKAGYITVSGSQTVTITKAAGGLTLSSSSGTMWYTNGGSITVTNNVSGGAISASSSDESAATVSVSGNTITITPKQISTTKNITITVKSAATTNYQEKTATYSLQVLNVYTITYNANGGNGAPNITHYKAKGRTINLSSTIPTRDNYIFSGWSSSSSATSSSWSAGGSYSNDSDNVLYAVWTPAVYYVANGTNKYHLKLQNAYDACSSTDTIKLLVNTQSEDGLSTSSKLNFTQNKNITFDLNGKTLELKNSINFTKGNITINNGTIKLLTNQIATGGWSPACLFCHGGNLTIGASATINTSDDYFYTAMIFIDYGSAVHVYGKVIYKGNNCENIRICSNKNSNNTETNNILYTYDGCLIDDEGLSNTQITVNILGNGTNKAILYMKGGTIGKYKYTNYVTDGKYTVFLEGANAYLKSDTKTGYIYGPCNSSSSGWCPIGHGNSNSSNMSVSYINIYTRYCKYYNFDTSTAHN